MVGKERGYRRVGRWTGNAKRSGMEMERGGKESGREEGRKMEGRWKDGY